MEVLHQLNLSRQSSDDRNDEREDDDAEDNAAAGELIFRDDPSGAGRGDDRGDRAAPGDEDRHVLPLWKPLLRNRFPKSGLIIEKGRGVVNQYSKRLHLFTVHLEKSHLIC